MFSEATVILKNIKNVLKFIGHRPPLQYVHLDAFPRHMFIITFVLPVLKGPALVLFIASFGQVIFLT